MMKKRFTRALYSMEAIEGARADFNQLAEIGVSEEEGYFALEFSRCRYDEAVTVMEFENYMIDLLNSRRPL